MFNINDRIEALLPMIVFNDILPLPGSEVRVDITNQDDIMALKVAEKYQNYVAILISQKKDDNSENDSTFLSKGLIGKIVLNMTSPAATRRVKLQIVARFDFVKFTTISGQQFVNLLTCPSVSSDPDKDVATINLIEKELFSRGQQHEGVENIETLQRAIKSMSPTEFSDILVSSIQMDITSRIKYLMEIDTTTRLLMALVDLRKQKMYRSLEQQIDNEVKKNINENQKEYYLREKMRAIQEELGDKARRDTEIDELRESIKKAKMPKNIEEKALAELNRYVSLPSNSAETGIIRTYLDFIVALPWNIQSIDSNDIKLAKDALDTDHYGLDKVKERILEYLAVRIMNQKNPQTILCLVGPPGVGKTSLTRSIARALNKNFVKQALGGVKDESEIRGHRRTYLGALPGRILQGMKKAGTNNPVFLLDEIDKMSSDYKGDPTSAMLEVLDSEQNRFFSDHYLEEPFDLSNVLFIATANYLGNIPAPLRDRMEIVELSSYTEYEKFAIARNHLLIKQLNLHGLHESLFTISDQAIYSIIQNYTREAGVRELERMLGAIIRKSIKNILMENYERIDVTVDNLEEYLGKYRYNNSTLTDDDKIGVVTGLAYTQFGGDTLQVEVTHYKGDGRLVLTGKLGDVMKESAQAALSYVKSNYDKFAIDYATFKESDIHIHVPEGAIPKDGPSAGVTIATAIISSFANRAVNHTVGMTGEITLRGQVLPIGGLREKSIAAHRSGLKTIVIPAENLRDLDEVPESVKNSLQIIPVKTVDEVINIALR